jgi:hypothetical protein
MHHTALRPETRRRLEQIGNADLLIGIPSFNNEGTIAHVVEMAAAGMVEHFPDLKPVLFNSDGGSRDGTPAAVTQAAAKSSLQAIVGEYDGPPGKGSAFRAIFEAAVILDCQACVVVDSDLRSITPYWMELLAGPIVRYDYGFVAPYYVRHKYDGTITNNLAYPLTRALYGLGVRQPIGGDFGFTSALARSYLEKDVWQSDVARFGIDIFMTTTAINEGSLICQANLGAKVHDPKDPAASLGPMFGQVVGTLFSLMTSYETRWRQVQRSQPAPRVGPPLLQEAESVTVTLEALVEHFREGAERFGPLWQRVMHPETYRAVRSVAGRGDQGRFSFPVESWARSVFDFAAAYSNANLERQVLIDALIPLYYGRTAGLVEDTREMSPDEFEVYVDDQALVFESLKDYLLERWDGSVP